ncbi:MAG: 5'(3')-deoxyribonucleotidase [Chitinophagaceae bacterium]|nr:MAG: 5'(3')-deoxyribonucleotidase [Chitinophagaceae bacterium]
MENPKKRIAVDMDGVLADVFEQFLDWDEREHGTRQVREKLLGLKELEVFKSARKHLYTEKFFRSLKVMEHSQEVLKRIHDHYDLYIVSAATEFPQSLPEKQEWLLEHFPFIGWEKIVFCGSKQIIQADIMIDDHFKNLDYFTGELSLLYTQPHNALSETGRHRRVESWREIEQILFP